MAVWHQELIQHMLAVDRFFEPRAMMLNSVRRWSWEPHPMPPDVGVCLAHSCRPGRWWKIIRELCGLCEDRNSLARFFCPWMHPPARSTPASMQLISSVVESILQIKVKLLYCSEPNFWQMVLTGASAKLNKTILVIQEVKSYNCFWTSISLNRYTSKLNGHVKYICSA